MVLGYRKGRAAALTEVGRQDFEAQVLQAKGPVMVVLRADGVEYGPFEAAVSKVHSERPGDFGLVRARLADLADVLDEYRVNKGYGAYNFERLPALALFREGRLVTTFNPTIAHPDPVIWEQSIHRQFNRFLANFVDYDPEKVTYNHKQ